MADKEILDELTEHRSRRKEKEKEEFPLNSEVKFNDGTVIKTYKGRVTGLNELNIEVGTTGHMGGDSGHGGRTYLHISDASNTDISCHIKAHTCDGDVNRIFDRPNIDIILGGDSELDTFCEALRIAYEVLSREACPIEDYEPSSLELRQSRFADYINDLCKLYREKGRLTGMAEVRNRHHITGITQQQFFECDLHHAKGLVDFDFCCKMYEYILDTTKATPAPRYEGD